MKFPPKAESVTVKGAQDGFSPPLAYEAQVIPGGHTRLLVSAPPERLAEVHRALLTVLEPPFRVLYRQLTDRATGQLPKPIDHVAVELPAETVQSVLVHCSTLVYHDGRHQLWVRGPGTEQVVLEELGVIFVYPDDPSFRDTLLALGLPERASQTLSERDYVKVNFVAEADAQEKMLIGALGLVRW